MGHQYKKIKISLPREMNAPLNYLNNETVTASSSHYKKSQLFISYYYFSCIKHPLWSSICSYRIK